MFGASLRKSEISPELTIHFWRTVQNSKENYLLYDIGEE